MPQNSPAAQAFTRPVWSDVRTLDRFCDEGTLTPVQQDPLLQARRLEMQAALRTKAVRYAAIVPMDSRRCQPQGSSNSCGFPEKLAAAAQEEPLKTSLWIESYGYELALAGQTFARSDLVQRRRADLQFSAPLIESAFTFIEAIQDQTLNGKSVHYLTYQRVISSFLNGFSSAQNLQYANRLAWCWSAALVRRANDDGCEFVTDQMLASQEEWALKMGQVCEALLENRREIGVAAGFAVSKMGKEIHKIDVDMFLIARGWLKGFVDLKLQTLHSDGRSNEDDDVLALQALYRNVSSILHQALAMKDPSYVIKAARSVVNMRQSLVSQSASLLQHAGQSYESKAQVLQNHIDTLISGAYKTQDPLGFVESFEGIFERIDKAVESQIQVLQKLKKQTQDPIALASLEFTISFLKNERTTLYAAVLVQAKQEDYVVKCVKNIKSSYLDLQPAKKEASAEVAQALSDYDFKIVARSLYSGSNGKYIRKVVKILPQLLIEAERYVTHKGYSNPKSKIKRLIALALYRGIFDFEKLPEIVT